MIMILLGGVPEMVLTVSEAIDFLKSLPPDKPFTVRFLPALDC